VGTGLDAALAQRHARSTLARQQEQPAACQSSPFGLSPMPAGSFALPALTRRATAHRCAPQCLHARERRGDWRSRRRWRSWRYRALHWPPVQRPGVCRDSLKIPRNAGHSRRRGYCCPVLTSPWPSCHVDPALRDTPFISHRRWLRPRLTALPGPLAPTPRARGGRGMLGCVRMVRWGEVDVDKQPRSESWHAEPSSQPAW
jgi:hypothetical protein